MRYILIAVTLMLGGCGYYGGGSYGGYVPSTYQKGKYDAFKQTPVLMHNLGDGTLVAPTGFKGTITTCVPAGGGSMLCN